MSDLPTNESQSERAKLVAEVAGSWGVVFPDGPDSVALIRAMRGDEKDETDRSMTPTLTGSRNNYPAPVRRLARQRRELGSQVEYLGVIANAATDQLRRIIWPSQIPPHRVRMVRIRRRGRTWRQRRRHR